MRRILLIAGLVAGAAAPPMLPSAGSADGYCQDRRVAGTVLGAVGGGLVGNAISHGAGGTLVGAGLGAFVGNNVAGSNCYRPHAYYRRPAPTHYHGAVPASRYATGPAACHYETRPFYDARGRLIYSPIQVCG